MPKPIQIIVKRKTLVPTKKQRFHKYRSDWKQVAKISYQNSIGIFKIINGTGKFENDAQFCKWLRDNLGIGIYFLLAWRKGKEGFWSFMKVDIQEDFYKRLPKNKTYEQNEIKKNKEDKRNLKRQIAEADANEKGELSEELYSIEEDDDDLKDIKKEGNKFQGPMQYLKSKKPLYNIHTYENYGKTRQKEGVVDETRLM